MPLFSPKDTGGKLNVHKTFRRRPGRLLNVLCTFNLRPVSTQDVDIYRVLTNDHFEGNVLNKLHIQSTFSNISLPFHGVHLIKNRL